MGFPIGTIIEEVRRDGGWDEYAQRGDSWIFFRPYVPGSPLERGFLGDVPLERRSRPVLTNSTVRGSSGGSQTTGPTFESLRRLLVPQVHGT